MSVQLLQTLSTVAFILSGVMFLVAIALFFLFNVPQLFGEVSGATARKAIESIRQQNEVSGNKAYRPSPVNALRGKLTDKITPSGKLETRDSTPSVSVGTSKLLPQEDTGAASETVLLEADAGATTLLIDDTDTIDTIDTLDTVQPATENTVASDYDGGAYNTDTGFAEAGEDYGTAGTITIEVDINFVGSGEIIE